MFSLICASTNGWVNNSEAGDLRCYQTHYYVTVMCVIMGSMITRVDNVKKVVHLTTRFDFADISLFYHYSSVVFIYIFTISKYLENIALRYTFFINKPLYNPSLYNLKDNTYTSPLNCQGLIEYWPVCCYSIKETHLVSFWTWDEISSAVGKYKWLY